MREPLKNEFSWSVSRDNTFRDCPRKYWFNYYGYWSGWEPDADKRTRQIYVLKQLQNRHTWVGDVVHECIRHSLLNVSRGIPVLPVDEILELTRNRMRADFRSSRAGGYHNNPKSCGLFEHEYDIEISNEEWQSRAAQVDHCLRNFYASEAWEQLRQLPPDRFLEIENFSEFRLDDKKIVIKLDCCVRGDDRIEVWDWKTGRGEPAEHRLQLACYAFYASYRYGVPITHVDMKRFELFHNRVEEDVIGERAAEELLSYLRGSIKDMQALLVDPANNRAQEDDFAKVARRDVCYFCNFLRVCAPDLGGPGRIEPRERPDE